MTAMCQASSVLVFGLLAVTLLAACGCGAVDWADHGFLGPLPIADPLSDNPSCREDSRLLTAALDNRTLWAEQMWDASAKGVVGLLTGTTLQYGDFDECMAVTHPLAAQYCLVTVWLNVPPGHDQVHPEEIEPATLSAWDKIHFKGQWASQRLDRVRLGLCVPATCHPVDLEGWLTRHLRDTNNTGTARVEVERGACSRPHDPGYGFTTGDIIYCVVMAIVFLVVTAATVYDLLVYDYDGHSPPANYVQCLSAYRGVKSLFRRDQGVAELDLNPLYGIHVFAFLFIVLGHRFGFYMSTTIINYEDVEYMFQNIWLSMWTGHMDLFCDIFFFLSAFLLGVILSIQLDKSYVSPLKVYLHRLIRLLPVYATILFFYATLFFKIGSGPIWNAVVKIEQDQCRDYWWVNLLFLNNYLGGDKMCLLQSWYVACDFQLFLAGTMLVLLLNRHSRLGLCVSGGLLVVATVAPFLGTYWHDRPAIITFYKGFWERVRENDLYTSVYSQAHYRGSGYLVGLLAGYLVYRAHRTAQPPHISKGRSWLLLAVGFAMCLLTYWSGALFTDTRQPYDRLQASLYAATNHLTFALGLALMITALILGHKTFVSHMFSWSGFVPLSKLSYCMYMVHNIPQIASGAAARTPIKFDVYGFLSWTVADLVLGLLLSLVVFLYIETPCRYLFKHLTTATTNHHPVKTREEDDVKDVKETSDWSYRLTNP